MRTVLLPLAMIILPAHAAHALEARVAKDVSTAPAAVWAAIGDFCGIAGWHPAVAKCEASAENGTSLRRLTLKDGAQLLEELVGRDEAGRNYTYTIEDSPLPVSSYRSTLKIVANGSGSTIEWTGTFAAKGAPDEDVVKLITGIYAAGIDGIAAKVAR